MITPGERRTELLHRTVAASLRRDGFTVLRPSPGEPRLLLVTKDRPRTDRRLDDPSDVLAVMCIRHRRHVGQARAVLRRHARLLGATPVVALPRLRLHPPGRQIELLELHGIDLHDMTPLNVDAVEAA